MIATRLLAPALALALGTLAVAAPAPAKAGDDLVRVLVDVADVVLRGGQPYYRHGHDDRLVVVRDRHGRVDYYRHVPRRHHRGSPPRGVAHGYYRNGPGRADCNSRGKCKVTWYDPRHDKKRYRSRNDRRHRGW